MKEWKPKDMPPIVSRFEDELQQTGGAEIENHTKTGIVISEKEFISKVLVTANHYFYFDKSLLVGGLWELLLPSNNDKPLVCVAMNP